MDYFASSAIVAYEFLCSAKHLKTIVHIYVIQKYVYGLKENVLLLRVYINLKAYFSE